MGAVASRKNIERVARLAKANPKKLGHKLGLVFYKSNIPAFCVIQELGISEPTFYRWIFGSTEIAKDRQPDIIKLIKQLTKAKSSGILPAEGCIEQRTQSFELAMDVA
jgi:hypothetical protein